MKPAISIEHVNRVQCRNIANFEMENVSLIPLKKIL